MKRIFAWLGIAVFAALYIIAILFAIIGGENAFPVIMTCLFLSVFLAVFLFVAGKTANYLKSRNPDRQDTSPEEKTKKDA